MNETVRVAQDGRGVATLRLARGDRHNAMSAQMMDEITATAVALGSDPAVRVVVLAAEGASFCAGGDLHWMRAQVDGGAEARAVEARRLAGMLAALDALPKPLVARVQGNAFGGGIGLLSVCDMAVAVDTATFALTEVRLGLIPATIAPYVIARIGAGAARRLFLSARGFGAAEAASLGLLSRVVAPDDLDAAVEAEIVPCLSCAPAAVAEAKALVARLVQPVTPAMVDTSVAALAARWEHPEASEGIAAFLARRKPSWQG